MLIGIDGNEANEENLVGIGRYALEVLKHLFLIGKEEATSKKQKLRFKIYLKRRPNSHLPKATSWWYYKKVAPKFFWTQIGLPLTLHLETEKPNVFFTPGHYAPRFSPCPCVISIMDLSYLHFPALFKPTDLYQLRNWTRYSITKAKKVLTISKYTKDDIIKHYKINEEDIVVTYPGYDRKKFKVGSQKSKAEKERIISKYDIGGDYILYVGTLQPRKNVERLIKAYDFLVKNSQAERVNNLKLVIVGKKGWLYNKIFETVKQLRLKDKVVFTGFVSDRELAGLYRQARCFVLPSLYEGFGLPVIEAMACGCPVVVSNRSSLPEIVGDAAIKVNPYKSIEIAKGIKKCLNKKESNKLVQKGLKRVKIFSWSKCAQQTYSVLREVALKTNC